MSFTNYTENAFLNHLLGGTSFGVLANVYVGLSTTVPNDDGTNFTEPSGGSYARSAVVNNSSKWSVATAGVKTNADTIWFPAATGSWGTVQYFGIFDTLTGGTLLVFGILDSPQAVATGSQLKFDPGDLEVELD